MSKQKVSDVTVGGDLIQSGPNGTSQVVENTEVAGDLVQSNGPVERIERIMMGDENDREHFPGVLYRREEVDESTGKPPNDAVIVQSVSNTYGFHPERLKQSKPEVLKIINEVVSDNFIKGSGGGYTFLALCEDRNGNQWTDSHRTMEALVALSIGLGLAGYCVPRDMWQHFPEGKPYIWFKRS